MFAFTYFIKKVPLRIMKNTIIKKYAMLHILTGESSPHVISILCLKTLSLKSKCLIPRKIFLPFFLASVLNILTVFFKGSDKSCALKKCKEKEMASAVEGHYPNSLL